MGFDGFEGFIIQQVTKVHPLENALKVSHILYTYTVHAYTIYTYLHAYTHTCLYHIPYTYIQAYTIHAYTLYAKGRGRGKVREGEGVREEEVVGEGMWVKGQKVNRLCTC